MKELFITKYTKDGCEMFAANVTEYEKIKEFTGRDYDYKSIPVKTPMISKTNSNEFEVMKDDPNKRMKDYEIVIVAFEH